MSDMFLIAAGLLSIMVSIIHGFLGETKVIKPIEGLEPSSLRIIRAVWFLSAVYWFVGGVFLVLAPYYFEPSQKVIIAGVTIAMYLSGALANFLGQSRSRYGVGVFNRYRCAYLFWWDGIIFMPSSFRMDFAG